MAPDPAPKHLTITLDFDLQTAGSTLGRVHHEKCTSDGLVCVGVGRLG
jgi:hypothetical protein